MRVTTKPLPPSITRGRLDVSALTSFTSVIGKNHAYSCLRKHEVAIFRVLLPAGLWRRRKQSLNASAGTAARRHRAVDAPTAQLRNAGHEVHGELRPAHHVLPLRQHNMPRPRPQPRRHVID